MADYTDDEEFTGRGGGLNDWSKKENWGLMRSLFRRPRAVRPAVTPIVAVMNSLTSCDVSGGPYQSQAKRSFYSLEPSFTPSGMCPAVYHGFHLPVTLCARLLCYDKSLLSMNIYAVAIRIHI